MDLKKKGKVGRSMATSENTVLVSFNVQLRSKQILFEIVPWTILPVDRVNAIVLFVCQNSRIELVCVVFKQLKIKTLPMLDWK
jgi:hypothetical protein